METKAAWGGPLCGANPTMTEGTDSTGERESKGLGYGAWHVPMALLWRGREGSHNMYIGLCLHIH